MNNRLVSVVMPTYNAAKYIGEAIESILKQTYKNVELLIVDDDSNDGTVEIITEFIKKDDRIQLIRGNKQGIGGALNLGIGIARGEYIARMDADDISLPMRIEKQVEYMEQNNDVGVCATQIQRFLHNKIDDKQLPEVFTDQDIKSGMLFSCIIAHPTVMFRKKLFDDGWRYTENVIAEDFDLWTRMIPDVKFACIEEVLLYYRRGSHNASFRTAKEKNSYKLTTEISRACIARLFKIDLTAYSENVFQIIYGYYVDDMSEFLEQQLKLLKEIDIQNQRYHVLMSDALRKSFQNRWNYILKSLSIADDVLKLYNALYVKELDALFSGDKSVGEYKERLDAISEYFRNFILKSEKIIIYGARIIGENIIKRYWELKEQGKISCKLEALVDKNVRNIEINGENYAVNDPQCLKQLQADIILVASVNYYEEIKHDLIGLGIDSQKIVNASVLWLV